MNNCILSICSEFILKNIISDQIQNIILEGKGFFIKDYYIVCPAHLVLIPPTILKYYYRIPELNIKKNIVRASKILITYKNVSYEANLIAIDGAGNIAILKIKNYKINSNKQLYLKLGDSNNINIDNDKFYFLYNNNIIETKLLNNKYVDSSGLILHECILLENNNYSSGVPILNDKMEIIGMITTKNNNNLIIGVSSNFMKIMIESFLNNDKDKFKIIEDPICNYLSYIKSYIGIQYNIFKAQDYNIFYDYKLEYNSNPDSKIILDNNLDNKIQGIKILGYNLKYSKNLNYYIYTGGCIESINLIDIGEELCPSLITWKLKPQNIIIIKYKLGGNLNYNNNYNNIYYCYYTLNKYPNNLDYPWYAISIFSDININLLPSNIYQSFLPSI